MSPRLCAGSSQEIIGDPVAISNGEVFDDNDVKIDDLHNAVTLFPAAALRASTT